MLLGAASILRASPQPFQLGALSCWAVMGVLMGCSSPTSPLLWFVAALLMAGVLQNPEKQQKARLIPGDTAEPHDSKTPATLQPTSPACFLQREPSSGKPRQMEAWGAARRRGSDTEPGTAEPPGRVPGMSSSEVWKRGVPMGRQHPRLRAGPWSRLQKAESGCSRELSGALLVMLLCSEHEASARGCGDRDRQRVSPHPVHWGTR